VDKGIYRYIFRHSLNHQVVLTVLSAASFPFLYAFYELPKEIINGAIQAKRRTFPVEFAGLQFDQIDFLFALCGLFLLLVAVNQSFKYVINVYQGLTAERLLRRLRYDLYARILRFPLPHFRKISSGELIQMITGEVEPLGGFFGQAVAAPAFQGGTLLVILGFLLAQNPYMAAAAVALYPIQFYFIPKLQRKVNRLGKERVRLVRGLADRIGETVAGVQEIHASHTSAYELAQFSRRLGTIYNVRFRIYIWKFVIKFINNTINQLGPFFFYSIGGYFVIMGSLDIGTLIAAIAAHKDLAAPWKELLAYYQQREDARIKYEQVIEQFEPRGLLDEGLQRTEPEEIKPLAGELAASNVGLVDESGTPLLEGATFVIDTRKPAAIVGGGGSGKDEVALLVSRLMFPTSGTITINGARLTDLPEAVTGRRIGYVGPGAFLFATSVRDNLTYGLKHKPITLPRYTPEEQRHWQKWFAEAAAAGNSTLDPNADWVDLSAAGVGDAVALNRRILEVLSLVGLEGDVYDLGLRTPVGAHLDPALGDRLLEARAAFRDRLKDPQLAALVEIFDAERYNENATLTENLLFGTPVGSAFDINRIAENSYVLDVIAQVGLTDTMLDVGQKVAATMVELFAGLPPGHHFFEQYSFISSEQLPEFQALLARIAREGMTTLKPEERTMLLSLPFKLSTARHRLALIDDDIKVRVLEARKLFHANLPEALRGAVDFFEADRLSAVSVQDNIIFGKIAYGQARGAERVGAVIGEVIDALDLRPEIMQIGLEFHVGIGGTRLSSAQRQKLAIARAILKRPDVLVLNEATVGLDAQSQARILDGLLEEFADRGIVWVLHRPSFASKFDRVIVLRSGKVVEQGAYADLSAGGGAFKELLAAD
jgi:ABC-type multidrug transport system fused ATPase/permease subunit